MHFVCLKLQLEYLRAKLLVEAASADDGFRHLVGITVGRGTTVLQVALLVLGAPSGDTDTGATVRNTCGEIVDG